MGEPVKIFKILIIYKLLFISVLLVLLIPYNLDNITHQPGQSIYHIFISFNKVFNKRNDDVHEQS